MESWHIFQDFLNLLAQNGSCPELEKLGNVINDSNLVTKIQEGLGTLEENPSKFNVASLLLLIDDLQFVIIRYVGEKKGIISLNYSLDGYLHDLQDCNRSCPPQSKIQKLVEGIYFSLTKLRHDLSFGNLVPRVIATIGGPGD